MRLITVNLVLALSLCHLAAPAARADIVVPPSLARDAQTVLDLANLRLDALAHASSGRSWVVATISPQGDKPVARGVDAGGADTNVLTRDGTVAVSAVLFGDRLTGWGYHEEWQVPNLGHHPLQPFYNSFREAGGCAIMLVHPTDGQVVVEETCLLPADWQGAAANAMEYFRAHEAEFRPPTADADRMRLLKLIADENPLVAIAAGNVLAATRHRDLLDTIGSGASASLHGIRLATLIYSALKTGPQIPPRDAAILLGGVIDRAAAPDDLHSVALGLLAARSGGGPTIVRLALLGVAAPEAIVHLPLADRIESTLWHDILQKQRAMGLADDEYLSAVFSRVDSGN
jgi:hypothetical protein